MNPGTKGPLTVPGPNHPYASETYAEALSHLGTPLVVPAWDTCVIIRPVNQTGAIDAMGCYPLAALSPDADLQAGLETLSRHGAVSVVLVADPLFGPDPERLGAAFPVCRPFKRHQVIDVSRPLKLARSHLSKLNRAKRRCRIEVGPLDPWLEDWVRLYADLVKRHAIIGPADFPPGTFATLSRLPGLVAIAAFAGDDIVAMGLWLRHGDLAYYHLGASSTIGYDASASYAIFDTALEVFGDCRFIDLGGAAGQHDAPGNGLLRFKRGFSNEERVAHLCGAVLNQQAYAALARSRPETSFFPCYRAPPAGG